MIAWLKGKKTFFVAAASLLWAVLGALLGKMSYQDALNVALAALGLASLRQGLADALKVVLALQQASADSSKKSGDVPAAP